MRWCSLLGVVTVRGRFELDDSDDVWEHVGLLLVNGCNLYLNIWSNLPLCNGNERVLWLSEDLHHLHCNITASETKDMARGRAKPS